MLARQRTFSWTEEQKIHYTENNLIILKKHLLTLAKRNGENTSLGIDPNE